MVLNILVCKMGKENSLNIANFLFISLLFILEQNVIVVKVLVNMVYLKMSVILHVRNILFNYVVEKMQIQFGE